MWDVCWEIIVPFECTSPDMISLQPEESSSIEKFYCSLMLPLSHLISQSPTLCCKIFDRQCQYSCQNHASDTRTAASDRRPIRVILRIRRYAQSVVMVHTDAPNRGIVRLYLAVLDLYRSQAGCPDSLATQVSHVSSARVTSRDSQGPRDASRD